MFEESTPDGICDCPMKGRSYENDGPTPCGEVWPGPDDLNCTRPEGHGGLHSACGVNVHPMEVWSDE